ncbi:hypothetical protein B0I35DRAFT_471058 [Stachybotrys elegans]|uniref:FAD-binding PCMH-type domain-containing protein n=1 Tax=Stachybotrys elegans TaxID=80388 RepID=A0A8K0SN39_9HYPO|nr:hypothetical protein B0I35DRAFT_471058 [Stachybotrys elegans]
MMVLAKAILLLIPGFASLAQAGMHPVQLACSAIQESLGSHIVNTAPLNQTLVRINWSATCIAEPRCIVQPTAPEHISETLQIIGRHKVKFAVRSGGHSPNPGAASIHDGILIDMSKFNEVSVSEDALVVTVGTGSRWGKVAEVLEPHNVSIVGARAPVVGVGGSLLGGGYSYFSGQYGLAVDNIKNCEVIQCICNVDETDEIGFTDPALKGGGPNFGIITKCDLFTVPINGVWYHGLLYLPDKAHQILNAFATWQKEGALDVKSNIALSIGLDQIIVVFTYAAPITDTSVFGCFEGIESLLEAIPRTNGTLHSLNHHDYRAVSSKIDNQLYIDMYDFWLERATLARHVANVNQTFAIQHVSRNVARAGLDKGGNPLGLPEEDHQWWTCLVDWEHESDDDLARSASIKTTDKWQEMAAQRNLAMPLLYMNDASRDQNPIASYGSENMSKLKAIALKYDPQAMFQRFQNGGFLLSRT